MLKLGRARIGAEQRTSFNNSKDVEMLRCPDKQSILLQQISEWASQQSKVANELTVLTSKAQEASHLFN
jgi:hypothetical protein